MSIPVGAYCCPRGCDTRVQIDMYYLQQPLWAMQPIPVRDMAMDPTRGRCSVECPMCGRCVDAVYFQPPNCFEIHCGCPVCEFVWNPTVIPARPAAIRIPRASSARAPPVHIKTEPAAPPGIRLLHLPPGVPARAVADDPRYTHRSTVCPRCRAQVESIIFMPSDDRVAHRACPACDHRWNPLDNDDAYAFVAPRKPVGARPRRKRR